MASRAIGLLVGGVGIVAGAGLAWFAPSPPATPRIDPQTIAAELDGRLRETAAGVHSRASTLAELPRLASAVATDSATLRDLTQDELAFRPKPGEIITIGQVPKSGGAKPTVLLTLPADAGESLVLDPSGARVAIVGGKLVVVEVIPVTPRERADELTGALAVSWPVDLASVAQRLDAVGAAARLEIGEANLAIGARALTPGEPTVPLALASDVAKRVRLLAAVPNQPTPSPPLRPVGIAVAVMALLAGLWLARKGAAQPLPVPVIDARLSSPGPSKPTTPAPSKLASSEALAATAMALEGSGEGTQVGRYTIVRRLGSGGMAEVFLARATGEAGFEKLVALKILHKNLALQPIVVEHFLDEARLASRLTHPNIVQIADLGKADNEYFIAMEYIEGADLEMLLAHCRERGQPVPLRVALTVLRKICDGLHAAHIATAVDGKPLELIHRDVKSANVFVARNGVVKVGDFGIAKANVESRVNKTEIGMVKGTAAYMAPEHRIGQVIDRRADLYAVGAIAYEILAGREVNLDMAVLAEKGRQGWPHLPAPSSIRPELPAALDAIVFRCLAYSKEDRYPDCAALEEALEAVAAQTNNVASDKLVAQWVEAALARSPIGADGIAS